MVTRRNIFSALSSLVVLMLLFAGGHGGRVSSQGALSIGGYQIVKQTRISASEWEITARATLFNGAAAVPGATATVVSLSPAAVIGDDSLTFGAIGAGASALSSDTFSFRQHPPIGFAGVQLRWTVTPGGGYVPPAGEILQGAAGSSALAALVRRDPVGAPEGDVVGHTILTRLDVAIRPDATVAQINAMLAAVTGGVVTMRPLFPVITVAVPRQADAAAIEALAATVGAMPGIRLAIPGRTLDLAIAPDHPATDHYNFDHLRAERFPAAWNAKQLADCAQKTTVIAADYFKFPAPAGVAAFSQQVPGVVFSGGSFDDSHGYNVMGTMAGTFDDDPPTGTNPFPTCLSLKGVSLTGLTYAQWPLAIEAVLPAAGNAVVNASLQFNDSCDDPCLNPNIDTAYERALAGLFTRHLLRPYQDRLLIVAAAGNHRDDLGQIYKGAGVGTVSSPFNVAASSDARMTWADDATLWSPGCVGSVCFQSAALTPQQRTDLDDLLADLGELNGARLKNVLIVGSTNSTAGHPVSTFSETGASIFAVGEDLPTFEGGFASGTSEAAPQISGLASYLMMMMPARHGAPGVVADVYAAIVGGATPSQFVDAYASLLSLDPSGAPDPATWNVRMALLDVDHNGHFDDVDVQDFAQRLLVAPNYDAPLQNAPQDDDRYDLNGDGYTGEGAVPPLPFDLERTGSFQFGGPLLETLTIQVGASHRTIDETAVSDLDVLCYYGYSPLYTGNTSLRDAWLAKVCKGQAAYEGTVSTIFQISGPSDSMTVTSNWTVKLTPRADGTFDATGTVAYALNSAASYPGGPSGSCSTTTIETGTGPVIYFGGVDDGNPANLPGELVGIFDLDHTSTDSCFGGQSFVFTDNALSLPFSLLFDTMPSDIMHGEYANGALTAIVWNFSRSTANSSMIIAGRLELVP